MMRQVAAAVVVLVLGYATALAQMDQKRYISVDEIQKGMKGVCKTVLSGTTIEEIPIEVLGVLRNFRPGQDLILVRFQSDRIEKTGLIQGMSGSPVYIGGRLAGAMAYGWSFTTEPIAGLTPIDTMLKLGTGGSEGGKTVPVELASTTIDPVPSLERWCPASQTVAADRHSEILTQMKVPICVGGLTPQGLAYLERWTAGKAFSVVGVGGSAVPGVSGEPGRLQPGASVCMELVRGDVSAFGVGTVTEVLGDRVLAMGHPLSNVGTTNFPMTTGFVHAILPRQEVSFKIASAEKVVGTFVSDQTAGLVGRLGIVPELVPMTVTVNHGGASRTYNFQVTDDPQLMLSLVTAVAASCITANGEPEPEATIELSTRIELDGLPPLVMSDTYAGPKALTGSLGVVVNPLGYVIHNPFRKPLFRKIEVTVAISDRSGRAAMTEVVLPRGSCRAGDSLEVAVTLLPVRAEKVRHIIKVPLPRDMDPGSYDLVVCDSDNDLRLDVRDRPHLYEARDLAQIIGIFNQPHPRNQLICRILTRRSGVAIGRRAFDRLPASALSILSAQARSDVTTFADPLRVSERLPYVVSGSYSTRIEVLPPEETVLPGPAQEDNE